jgi:hypothetical protein
LAWRYNKLEPTEIQYLELNNLDSDGNIKSEFYDAQINIEFTHPIREVELILFKTKLSKLTTELFGFSLYKTTECDVMEIVSLCSKFKRIEFDSEDDIKRFLSYWNEELIEDLNVAELKKVLTENGVSMESGNKGLKLLEKFLKNVLKIENNIIAPLYYLYDLRLWADHREMQSHYDNVLTKLAISQTSTFSHVYNTLVLSIYELDKKLNDNLLEKKNTL